MSSYLEVPKSASKPPPKRRVAASAQAAIPTQPWPAALPDQVRAVAELLTRAGTALTLADIEARFNGKGAWKRSLLSFPRGIRGMGDRFNGKGAWKRSLLPLLQTLEVLGRAQRGESAATGEGGSVLKWRA